MANRDDVPAKPAGKRGWKLGAENLERLLSEAAAFRGESLWQDAWRRLRASRASYWALIFIVLVGVGSLLAPIMPLPSPVTIGLGKTLEGPGAGGFGDDGWRHRTTVWLAADAPLDAAELGRLSDRVAALSGRTPKAPQQTEMAGEVRYGFDLAYSGDDRPRVDYEYTGRSGRAWGVRAIGQQQGASRTSFNLPVARSEIAAWEVRTSPDRVDLEIRTTAATEERADLRYSFYLRRAEKTKPQLIRLNGDEVPPLGPVSEESTPPKPETAKPGTEKPGTAKAGTAKAGTAKAGTAKAGTAKNAKKPPSPPVPVLDRDGRVRPDKLREWLVAVGGADTELRAEEFDLTIHEERAIPHGGLVARVRSEFEGDTTVRVAGVDPVNAYWDLNFFDRGLVWVRAKLFGSWRTGNWLGTDVKGRDLLSRIIWGSRTSILVALAAALCSLIIGVTYGAFSGLVGGRIDNLMMRIVDILYSIPFIFVVIFLITIVNSNRTVLEDQLGIDRELIFFLVVGAIYWLTMARVVRGQVLSLKNTEFVEATRVLGASTARILFVHIVPNVLSVVIVYLTLTIPAVMLFEAFLSFLGLGIEPPKVSWGLLAVDGTEAISPVENYWWLVAFPALAMGTTLLALNILGDGLRDALDPKLRGKD